MYVTVPIFIVIQKPKEIAILNIPVVKYVRATCGILVEFMTHLCLIAIINEEVKENFKCENNTRLRCIQGVIRKKREKRNIQGSSMLLKKSKYLNILT